MLYHAIYIPWLHSAGAQPSLHHLAYCDVHLFFLPFVHQSHQAKCGTAWKPLCPCCHLFRPWLLLKCFLLSPWTGQEQWRLLPSGISCCWAVTFPPAEGICYRPELKQSGGGGFEFMSSRVRFPLKRLEKDQSLPLPSCLAVSYTNQFYSPIFWRWGYGQLFWRREQCCGSRVSKLLRLLKGRSKASCLQYFPVGQL